MVRKDNAQRKIDQAREKAMQREAAQLDPAAAIARIVEDLQNMHTIATAIATAYPADSGAVAVAVRWIFEGCCDVGRRKWRQAGSPGDGTDDAWLTWLLEQASIRRKDGGTDDSADSATA